MSKPDWKDAPEWARWLAQDNDGAWWWYSDKPEAEGREWSCERGECEHAAYDLPPRGPVEPRP